MLNLYFSMLWKIKTCNQSNIMHYRSITSSLSTVFSLNKNKLEQIFQKGLRQRKFQNWDWWDVIPELARISSRYFQYTVSTARLFCSFQLALTHARFQTDSFAFSSRSSTVEIRPRLRRIGFSSARSYARATEDLLGSSGLTLRFQAGMEERSQGV